MNLLRIDCGSCTARGPACGDCMVTALLGADDEPLATSPPGVVEFYDDEVSALKAMTAAGLLPPLRLVRGVAPRRPATGTGHDGDWFVSGQGVV